MAAITAEEPVPTQLTLSAGQVHAGFRLLSWRARGGMGQVWKADRSGVPFALKFIVDDQEGNPGKLKEYVKRMELEWRALDRVEHPNVVKPIELNLTNQPPFLVLEWLEGKPLSEVYSEGTRPTLPRTIAYVIDALRGLERVHEEGIVHRDIKPSNLFLTDGRVKLIDFGIAAAGDATRVTRTDLIAGSLPYFAPERIEHPNDDAAPASDVYSMGITLYELMTGELPFWSQNAGQLLAMHLNTTMPDIRRKLPGTPDDLAEIVERATRKKPEDRYRDAGQLLEALESFAARSRIAVPPEPVIPPRVNGRAIASETDFAQALGEDGGYCEALIGDPRAQRRLQGWLTSVGGPGHSQAFRALMETLRDSPEDPWRQQERLVRFFDPNRPIRVGSREIKVTGNLAYAEREVLSALDEALPSLTPEEIERCGWALTVCLETRLPARAGLYRKLSTADVIELGWQRDPKRGFHTRDRERLESLQDVTLHFLRQPESYDERLLAQERIAFLARTLPAQRDTGLSDLAYLAFPAEGQRAIRFDGLVVDEDGYALHYGIDRSLVRFLKHEGVRPGVVNPLKGAAESVSLALDDIPEPFRHFPAEVASRLEGKLWERLGCPREPPAGWWAVQQQLARAARDKVQVRGVPSGFASVVPRNSSGRTGVALPVVLVVAGLFAGGALVFFLGPHLLSWQRSEETTVNRSPEKGAGALESDSAGNLPSGTVAQQQSGTKIPANGPRAREGSAVSAASPVSQSAGGKLHARPKVHVEPAPEHKGPALVVPIPDVALPDPVADSAGQETHVDPPAPEQVAPARGAAPVAPASASQ